MQAQPRLTIVVPTFNGAERLPECLTNIAGQTYREFICIILNNASTDGTSAVADAFALADVRFKHIGQPQHLAVLDNFADGAERVTTKFFAWRADDDMWAPDYLEKLMALLDADPSRKLAVAGTTMERVEGGKVQDRGAVRYPDDVDRSDKGRMQQLHRSTPSWMYGIYDSETFLPLLREARASYPEVWGIDQLMLFNLALRGLIVGTNETTFRMRRFAVTNAKGHRWKKGNTIDEQLDFDVDLRRRFYRLGAKWISEYVHHPVRAFLWRLFLRHFIARTIMPARTIWRRRVRQRFRAMLGKT